MGQSVAAYFGNDISTVSPSNWKKKLQECTESPVGCLPEFQQPIDPSMILGGLNGVGNVADSPAMIVTWVVKNYAEGSLEVEKAMDWEQSLKDTLLEVQRDASERGLRLSFSTEISLEQELNKSTNTDAKIVVISYIFMFIYASLALGSTTLSIRSIIRNPASSLVESKFTLGVVGILIVLMSISASIGLFSAAGIKVTLIIAEVIPFIVLAVGVDNIFLIVHEFERVNVSHPDEMVEFRIAKALGRMGPSILLSAITETIAFSLGAFVGMPAVRNFAVYAAGAVFINAVLQVTMFVSVLTLNQRRVEDRRADCFPCIQIKRAGIQLSTTGNGYMRPYEGQEEGTLQKFIRKSYAPTLLGKKMKMGVVVVFLGIFTAGVSLIPEVALGLDQRVAIPDDSYLIPYFNDLYDYFESGPPVYFITRELNVTQRQHQQQLCSRFSTCESDSITNIIEGERKRSNVSYIASTPASWIDDYFRWLDPNLAECCVENGKTCFADRDPAWNISLYGMPEGQEFMHYLEKWVEAPSDADCPLGGKAAYSSALVIDAERETIPASHFRTAHTPLRSQDAFIDAYASARRIADGLSKSSGVDVFPYSVFYIFFDQYATIVRLTATLLGSALALILAISSVLLGSVRTGAVVTATVIMIVVDIIGTMALFNVSLNAVSLVNLIICVGIGVEFCAHIARAFMFPSRAVMERASKKFRGKDARAWTALVNVGGSVFSGITITKLLGVSVLAFTRSKIFEIYYFRIWLALVVFAATHALIFLPVALSLLGGEGYMDPESEGGLEEDLASRRYRAFDIREKLRYTAAVQNPPHLPPKELIDAIELISADKLAAYIKLYFRHWHKHAPMVHEATFNPCTAALPLVLSLMSLGGMYSKESEDVAKLKGLLDTIEGYILSIPGLSDEYEMPGRLYAKHGEAASAEWQQYQLEELQGAYLMIVLQYWTGNPTARTRVRQQRFPKVVHVCLNPDQNITGLTIADFPSSGCTHNATLSGPSDKR